MDAQTESKIDISSLQEDSMDQEGMEINTDRLNNLNIQNAMEKYDSSDEADQFDKTLNINPGVPEKTIFNSWDDRGDGSKEGSLQTKLVK